MPKTLRVALCMGGGVSLGSFSGGALGEVVRLLQSQRKTAAFDRVEIDVLAGSSAGALSLAVLLRTLADPARWDQPNAVLEKEHEAWVKEIDIGKLVPAKRGSVGSILDRGAVDEIARKLLGWAGSGERDPARSLLARRVLFACTLTNLTGIPLDLREKYARDANGRLAFADALRTTLYRDLRIFELHYGAPVPVLGAQFLHVDPADRGTWRTIAATAIACGAFPLAFEPVVLNRTRSEYGQLWPEDLAQFERFPFTYADGGIFNNEPLREAMELSRLRDLTDRDEPFSRLVIFIDPNFSADPANFSLSLHAPLHFEKPNSVIPGLSGALDGTDVKATPYTQRILANAGALIRTVAGQAAFKDWLKADKINHQIQWRDQTLELVARMLPYFDPARLHTIRDEVRNALQGMLAEKSRISAGEPTGLRVEAEIARVEMEDASILAGIPATPHQAAHREIYCLFAAALDQLGGLRRKVHLPVLPIAPVRDGQKAQLAGDFLRSFGGFFEESYREYDFQVGVAAARQALRGYTVDGIEVLAADGAEPQYPIESTPGVTTDPTLGSTPRRAVFERRLADVTADMVDGFLDLPFGIDKLAGTLVSKMRGFLIRRIDASAPVLQVPVRIRLLNTAHGNFQLLPAKSGNPIQAYLGRDGLVLDSLVQIAGSTGHRRIFAGTHVWEDGQGYFLRVQERSGPVQRSFDVRLAEPGEQLRQLGLPIWETSVDLLLARRSEWKAAEELKDLATQLEE